MADQICKSEYIENMLIPSHRIAQSFWIGTLGFKPKHFIAGGGSACQFKR